MSSPVPPGGPLLRVRRLSVTHAGAETPTPRELTLDVTAGEVVLVLGPSGSGKSTLALSLNGLIPHEIPATLTGAVEAGGRDTSQATVAELSMHTAMVFQDPDSQLVTGTVLDEVAFGPENLRLPVAEVLARSESALRRMQLWHRRDENPDVLSGGGRQRLALACALAMDPQLLVLDEPTANLDPSGAADLYAALAGAAGEGRSVVLIEHDLDAAVEIATRVVVLDREGRLALDGTVDVLRERAPQLLRMGVWLPQTTLAALRLRDAGYRIDPLPLTPAELRTAFSGDTPPTAGGHERVHRTARSSPRADSLIRVRGLNVDRGRKRILHDIDLDVPEGAFTAFVGPNGAGKTTLLQALTGVVAPPRGRIRIAGLDPGRAPPRRLVERIGFVFQNPEHQFVTHTVRDELAYGLRRLGRGEREVRDRVDAMLGRLGMSGLAEAHPFRLSGGEKRRLSVGTALIAEPSVLAFDEPTYGQDRARAGELLGMLRDLNHQGITVLIVTHDLHLVAEYASRAVALSSGRIVADGSPKELFFDGGIERAGLSPPELYRSLGDYPPAARAAIFPATGPAPGGEE